MVNRHGPDMSRFTDKDRTQDLTKGAEAILNYAPKSKCQLNKNKTINELEIANNNPPNEITVGGQ